LTVARIVHAFAGTFVLVSVALGLLVNPWWFAATAFVGANLLQSALTRWCLLANILRRLGVKDEQPGPAARA
jgi:hypothetical protein